MNRQTAKKQFLIKIREKKDVLFGAFSAIITKEKKCQEWREIADFAKSVCLIPPEKEWTYARDVLWQNIKKGTVVSSNVVYINTNCSVHHKRKTH